eukprot:COSAG02_NODE_4652_length_5132_cov_2.838069_4_plen_151_part_00
MVAFACGPTPLLGFCDMSGDDTPTLVPAFANVGAELQAAAESSEPVLWRTSQLQQGAEAQLVGVRAGILSTILYTSYGLTNGQFTGRAFRFLVMIPDSVCDFTRPAVQHQRNSCRLQVLCYLHVQVVREHRTALSRPRNVERHGHSPAQS